LLPNFIMYIVILKLGENVVDVWIDKNNNIISLGSHKQQLSLRRSRNMVFLSPTNVRNIYITSILWWLPFYCMLALCAVQTFYYNYGSVFKLLHILYYTILYDINI
jgi:hypothetical protein